MQLPRGGAGLATRRPLIVGVLAATAVLVAACSSSHPAAGSSAGASASAASSSAVAPATSAPSASASAPSASAAAAAPSGPSATSPTAPVTPGGTVDQTCAQKAKDAFVHITSVRSAPGGTLIITGNPSALVCGGPDDFHFNIADSIETGHVVPGATIQTFPLSKMAPERIQPSQLAAYLATDQDTRIFLIGGSLSAIGSLQEQFHP
ncbi:MAG: hypothetical protein ACLPQY_03820 [Streptosporangiaceae bacterium]